MHSRAQESTGKVRGTSCQGGIGSLLWRQIEPGSLKNFAAQLIEGARAERFMRPRFFLGKRVQEFKGPRGLRLNWVVVLVGWSGDGSSQDPSAA